MLLCFWHWLGSSTLLNLFIVWKMGIIIFILQDCHYVGSHTIYKVRIIVFIAQYVFCKWWIFGSQITNKKKVKTGSTNVLLIFLMDKAVRFISKWKLCWVASDAGGKDYLPGTVKLPECRTVWNASHVVLTVGWNLFLDAWEFAHL